jgi:hypothetical protein
MGGRALNKKFVVGFSVMFLMLSIPAWVPRVSAESGYDLVGIKVGDWVKYNVRKVGQPGIWVPPFERTVSEIEVEVRNVSGTTITIGETVDEETHLFSKELQNTKSHGYWYYIIAANLSAGDQIGELRALKDTNYNWVDSTLSINATVSRDYGGASREVNLLRWSYLLPVYEYIFNFSQEHCWDKETGFLLERTWEQYALGYWKGSGKNATWSALPKNETWSMLQLEIADTNMWKMEMVSTFWSEWRLLAISGVAATAIFAAAISLQLSRNRKQHDGGL